MPTTATETTPTPSPAMTVEATYIGHDIAWANGSTWTNYDPPKAEATIAHADRDGEVVARFHTTTIEPRFAGLTVNGDTPVWSEVVR